MTSVSLTLRDAKTIIKNQLPKFLNNYGVVLPVLKSQLLN